MLLQFPECLLKTENVIKRTDRPPLNLGAKITLFITYTDCFCKKVT